MFQYNSIDGWKMNRNLINFHFIQLPQRNRKKVIDNKEREERMEIKKQLKSALDWSAEMFTKSNKIPTHLFIDIRVEGWIKRGNGKSFFIHFDPFDWFPWISASTLSCLDMTTKSLQIIPSVSSCFEKKVL